MLKDARAALAPRAAERRGGGRPLLADARHLGERHPHAREAGGAAARHAGGARLVRTPAERASNLHAVVLPAQVAFELADVLTRARVRSRCRATSPTKHAPAGLGVALTAFKLVNETSLRSFKLCERRVTPAEEAALARSRERAVPE